MDVIVGWIVGNTQSGPHSFRKKKPFGWQYSDGLVTQSYHESEVARLRAELADAHAAIESKAGWEWKKEADYLRAEVQAYRKDAERWQHARKLLSVDDIAERQRTLEEWNFLISEDECKRADEAIDAAMGASA